MKAYIVLATYNGERWLTQQLDSLMVQTESDWMLIARDDGSSDGSTEILANYAARDSRLMVLDTPSSAAAMGAADNFRILLQRVEELMENDPAPVFLCDQDDLWEAGKIAAQLADLATAPASCHDVEYMDELGQLSGRKMLLELGLPPPTSDSLLAQNSVVGCTLALTPQVLDLALPFPEALVNHDWWLGICAACLGDIAYTDDARVKYRQHATNAVGGYRPASQLGQLPRLLRRQRAVLRSQLEAVTVLGQRLEQRGKTVPETFERYLRSVGSTGFGQRLAALSRGRFAARSKSLRVLRAAAAIKPL